MTSAPRSLSTDVNTSCSCCARPAHGRPSKSSRLLVRGVIRLSSGPGRCTRTVLSPPTSLSAPMVWLTIPPRSPSPRPRRQPLKAVSPVRGRLRLSGRLVLDAAIELAKVSGAGPALNPAAPFAGPVAATVPRGPDDGPDRQAGAVRPYPPGIAQMRDDAEPAATERRHGGLGRLRPGRTAAVADRDLDRAAVDIPGHPETLARQRVRVQDGIAQQLAHDKRRVADRGIKDSGRTELSTQFPARHCDARRRTWQQHDARRPHLLEHPSRCRDALDTSTSMAAFNTGR